MCFMSLLELAPWNRVYYVGLFLMNFLLQL